MPAGRPSKYRAEFAAIAYDTMALGFSKTATAGKLGVAKSTFDRWCDEHPEFQGAIKRGEAARTYVLERDLLSAPDGPNVTSRIFALKNAAPDEWKDLRENKSTVTVTHSVQEAADEFSRLVASVSERAGTHDGPKRTQ